MIALPLWVNSKGKRYVNEEVALALMNMGTVYCQLRDGISWTVFDEDFLENLETRGSALAMGEFLQINKPVLNARSEIDENFARGDPTVAKAYTIDVPGSTNGFAHTSRCIAGRKAIEIIQE